MTQTADVVIVGAGVIGSSIAYHLAHAGCGNVLVVERESHQGLGSTGKSMGGVRAQFSTDINILMSLYSIDVFANFEEITGSTAGYKPHGYLFMATTDQHLAYLTTCRERQIALGRKGVEMVTRDEILKMVPQLEATDVLAGCFCEADGLVDPNSVMTGFMSRARLLGVKLWMDTTVLGIETDGDQISAVVTSRGRVATRTVVNAAGPWAKEVAGLAGVDLPVTPQRRHIVKTEPFDQLPRRFPMVIDMSTGFHFRREGTTILLAWNDPEDTPGFQTRFDPTFIEKVLTHAVKRAPCFADAAINPSRCWAGMYEMSPDHHAIIGPAPGVEGLFFANGFSGHGVMHSPATGRIMSDLIANGKSTFLDPTPLFPERLMKGYLIQESSVL